MALQKLVYWIAAMYLAVVFLGLSTAQVLNAENVRAFGDDINNSTNSLFLVLWILFTTGIILFLLRYKRGFDLVKLLEAVALFSSSTIVLTALAPAYWFEGMIFVLALVLYRHFNPSNILLKNSFAVLAASGVAAVVGVSLGLVPILVFMVLLAVYDYIAVFKTKHMIVLAKKIQGSGLSMTAEIPTSKHSFQLGTGDLAIPVAAGISTTLFLSPIAGAMAFLGAFGGILWTITYVSSNVGKALPAIPPITAGLLSGLALYYALSLALPL